MRVPPSAACTDASSAGCLREHSPEFRALSDPDAVGQASVIEGPINLGTDPNDPESYAFSGGDVVASGEFARAIRLTGDAFPYNLSGGSASVNGDSSAAVDILLSGTTVVFDGDFQADATGSGGDVVNSSPGVQLLDTTVDGGSFATSGEEANIFGLGGDTTTLTVNGGIFEATGNGAEAIIIDAGTDDDAFVFEGQVIFAGATISTNGVEAAGIGIDGRQSSIDISGSAAVSTFGPASVGAIIGTASEGIPRELGVITMSSGSVSTSGESSHGLVVQGNSGEINFSGGTIATPGGSSIGLRIVGDDGTVRVSGGSIQATGGSTSNPDGDVAASAGVEINGDRGIVEVTGGGTPIESRNGVRVFGNSGRVTIADTGIVATDSFSGQAITIQGNDGGVILDGATISGEGSIFGIVDVFQGSVAVDDSLPGGFISVTGDSSVIATDGGSGLSLGDDDGRIEVFEARVEVSGGPGIAVGAIGDRIRIDIGVAPSPLPPTPPGGIETIISIDTQGSGSGARAVSGFGDETTVAIEGEQTQLVAIGDRSAAVQLSGVAANMTVRNATLSAEGEQAKGMILDGIDAGSDNSVVLVEAAGISATGSTASAVEIQGTATTLTLNLANVEADGTEARGAVWRATSSPADDGVGLIEDSNIAVTGEGSSAVAFEGANRPDVTVSRSTLSATGANAGGITITRIEGGVTEAPRLLIDQSSDVTAAGDNSSAVLLVDTVGSEITVDNSTLTSEGAGARGVAIERAETAADSAVKLMLVNGTSIVATGTTDSGDTDGIGGIAVLLEDTQQPDITLLNSSLAATGRDAKGISIVRTDPIDDVQRTVAPLVLVENSSISVTDVDEPSTPELPIDPDAVAILIRDADGAVTTIRNSTITANGQASVGVRMVDSGAAAQPQLLVEGPTTEIAALGNGAVAVETGSGAQVTIRDATIRAEGGSISTPVDDTEIGVNAILIAGEEAKLTLEGARVSTVGDNSFAVSVIGQAGDDHVFLDVSQSTISADALDDQAIAVGISLSAAGGSSAVRGSVVSASGDSATAISTVLSDSSVFIGEETTVTATGEAANGLSVLSFDGTSEILIGNATVSASGSSAAAASVDVGSNNATITIEPDGTVEGTSGATGVLVNGNMTLVVEGLLTAGQGGIAVGEVVPGFPGAPGSGDQTVQFTGTGIGAFNLGSDNDRISVSATGTLDGAVDLGAGNDIFALFADSSLVLAATEVVTGGAGMDLLSIATVNSDMIAAGDDFLAFETVEKGGARNLTLNGTLSTDVFDLQAGTVAVGGNLDVSDRVSMGTDTDLLLSVGAALNSDTAAVVGDSGVQTVETAGSISGSIDLGG